MKDEKLQDRWDRDPSVQMMRRVFARMENLQAELIERLRLSPVDERLRRIRELARGLFEKAWPVARRRGVVNSEEEVATLYIHCLIKILEWERIEVPGEVFLSDPKLVHFLSENFR
jgi:hypothetical protein